jgi:hypothetical protein
MNTSDKLYLHCFFRDDMEDMCWNEYVISNRSNLSSEWRHIPNEESSVLDWGESSDIIDSYPTAVKVNCYG